MDLQALKLAVYRRLPRGAQVRAVRLATPNFTVGTIGLITRDGTSVLLVRPSYREGWLPPGGFIDKGELPLEALTREIEEELGVRMSFEPTHRVAFDLRRQGITFVSAGLAPPGAQFVVRRPELLEAAWFPLDALPPLPHDFFEGMPEEDLDAMREVGQGAG